MGSHPWDPKDGLQALLLPNYSCGEQINAHCALLEEVPADPRSTRQPQTLSPWTVWGEKHGQSSGVSWCDLREATKEMLECGALPLSEEMGLPPAPDNGQNTKL